MKITGEATLHAPVEKVFAALNDPAVLVRTIPGCHQLERVGPDAYRMTVSAGVAAIKGTYAGEVLLTDQQPPHAFVLKASGAGSPGTVSAEVQVRLHGDGNGTTTLTYNADAVVGGMVGGVGQRVLASVARKTAGEFFAAVDGVLAGVTLEASSEEGAPLTAYSSTGAPSSGTGEAYRAEAASAVFTRPAPPTRAFPGGDFAAGVLFGAAAALAGVIVGGLIARRHR
jgi:carbon monoxide dehydrogenase subunit G